MQKLLKETLELRLLLDIELNAILNIQLVSIQRLLF